MNNRLVSLRKFADRLSIYETNQHQCVFDKSIVKYTPGEWCFTLKKWNLLNRTEVYKNLRNEVHMVTNYEDLYCHVKYIMEPLQKYLALRRDECMEAVIELTKAIAYDLGSAFYPYMFNVVELIIKSLDTNNPDILETAFTALAYFFGRHCDYFCDHFTEIMALLLPLSSRKKSSYMKNFATDSVVFIIRKFVEREITLEPLFDLLTFSNEQQWSRIFADVIIDNTAGTIRPCAEHLLNDAMKFMQYDPENDKLTFHILRETFIRVRKNIQPKNSKIIWQVLYKSFDECLESMTVNDDNARILPDIMFLAGIFVSYQYGEFLLDPEALACRVYKVVLDYENYEEVFQEAKDLAVAIVAAEHSCLTDKHILFLISKITDILDKENSVLLDERERFVKQVSCD